jgi:hypothetical protein
MPGLASVGEVASVLNVLGSEIACALGLAETLNPIMETNEIILRRINLFHSFV